MVKNLSCVSCGALNVFPINSLGAVSIIKTVVCIIAMRYHICQQYSRSHRSTEIRICSLFSRKNDPNIFLTKG